MWGSKKLEFHRSQQCVLSYAHLSGQPSTVVLERFKLAGRRARSPDLRQANNYGLYVGRSKKHSMTALFDLVGE